MLGAGVPIFMGSPFYHDTGSIAEEWLPTVNVQRENRLDLGVYWELS